jgi:hypothetical protein
MCQKSQKETLSFHSKARRPFSMIKEPHLHQTGGKQEHKVPRSILRSANDFNVHTRSTTTTTTISNAIDQRKKSRVGALFFVRTACSSAYDNKDLLVVEMIVKSNIGGIVTVEYSVIVALPDTIWKEDSVSGLVPASESARNLIAINVLYFEEFPIKGVSPCRGTRGGTSPHRGTSSRVMVGPHSASAKEGNLVLVPSSVWLSTSCTSCMRRLTRFDRSHSQKGLFWYVDLQENSETVDNL